MSKPYPLVGAKRPLSKPATHDVRTDRDLFNPRYAGRLAVQAWLGSRLVLMLVLLVVVLQHGWPLSASLTNWDAAHFLDVARSGYTDLAMTAYFPGLPLVMAGFGLIGVPGVVTGVLLGLVGSGFAAWALYRLAGGAVAGTLAVVAWSFAPVAVFTAVPYTEAPFCALAFWAWWYAKQNRWALAAGLAAGACLFRVSGVFLIAGLLVMVLVAPEPARVRGRRIAWLGLPVGVLAAYTVYLRVRFGSWTAWLTAQAVGWNRHFDWPWAGVAATAGVAGLGGVEYDTSAIFRWELAALAIGAVTAAWAAYRRWIPEAVWVATAVLALACQGWLLSLARSMILWLPLFALVGTLGVRRTRGFELGLRRVTFVTWYVLEAAVMVWWAVRFFTNQWAG